MDHRLAAPRSPRYMVALPVRYQALPEEGRVSRTGSGQTRDLSETGACLDLPDPFALGASLSLALHVESDSLTVQAAVVWVEQVGLPSAGTRHGVSFPQISPEQRQGLQALLRRNRAVRSRVVMVPPLPVRSRAGMQLRLLDLSLSGACIEHLTRLQPGASCVLEFPPALGPFTLSAQVVRSLVVGVELGPEETRRLRYESGVAFVQVTPDQRAALAQVLEHLAAGETETGVEEASSAPLVGRVLKGRYRLVRKLAIGHAGVVYFAREVGRENRLAVKVLDAKYAQDDKGAQGFRQLMLAVAALSKRHRNLVRVYDCDWTEDGRVFIAMEYLEGRPLSELLRQAGGLEMARALHLALQMAEGLGALHDAGIVHADIQPQHFMVVGEGEALKLIGFEMARWKGVGPLDPLLDTQGIPRAPEYLAPEQIEGGKLSPQTDIYALGVVLYQMLTGVVPFRAATPEEVRAMHLHTAPTLLKAVRPEVPVMVEARVLEALEKDPKWRGNTVRDVVSEFPQELAAERARGKAGQIRGLRMALQAGKDRARRVATKYGMARWGWKLAVIIGLLILAAVPLWWMASARQAREGSSAQSPQQSPDAAPRSEPASAREPDWKASGGPSLPSQDSPGGTSPGPPPPAPESTAPEVKKPAEEIPPPAPTHRMAESSPNARLLEAPRREGADTRGPDTQAPKTKADTHATPPDPTDVIDWLLKHRETVRH